MSELLKKCKEDMQKRIDSMDHELGKVRTGRASVALLDSVRVDYYGAPTPLNQVASLATPDARTIVITPFEKKALSDIERGVHMASLGLQPTNDGNVIRISIPPLTEDRRKELVKAIKKTGEEAKVGLRKVRQDLNTKIKKMEKAKEITEDESRDQQKEIQAVTDDFVKVIDERVSKKEKEAMTV